MSPPSIALVSDAGNDQGKQVQLRVLRGSADTPGAGVTITRYEVYRRNDALPGAATQSAQPAAIQLAGWTYVTWTVARCPSRRSQQLVLAEPESREDDGRGSQ